MLLHSKLMPAVPIGAHVLEPMRERFDIAEDIYRAEEQLPADQCIPHAEGKFRLSKT